MGQSRRSKGQNPNVKLTVFLSTSKQHIATDLINVFTFSDKFCLITHTKSGSLKKVL